MTPDRMAQLAQILGVPLDRAERLWKIIEFRRLPMEWTDEARARVPAIKDEIRDLEAISRHARELKRLISEKRAYFAFAVEPKLETSANERRRFLRQLDAIASDAERFSKAPDLARKVAGLPRAEDARTATEALELWPQLFDVWRSCGRRLAYTPNGPLHRFFKLVHEELGVPAPSASSLRDAIRRRIATYGQTLP